MRLKYLKATLFICVMILISSATINAQSMSGNKFVLGGRFGLSILDGSAGLQLGPMGQYYINSNMSIGSEFNINTQGGTPIEWNGSFFYDLESSRPNIQPYLDGGMSLWFYTGGPYFGLRFGGGVNFNVAPNIDIPADIQIGPVFGGGTTVFYFALTTGIRYSMN